MKFNYSGWMSILLLILSVATGSLAFHPLVGPSMSASRANPAGFLVEIPEKFFTRDLGAIETLIRNNEPVLLKRGNYNLTFEMFDNRGHVMKKYVVSPCNFIFPYREKILSIEIPSQKLAGAARVAAVLSLEGKEVARSLPMAVIPDINSGDFGLAPASDPAPVPPLAPFTVPSRETEKPKTIKPYSGKEFVARARVLKSKVESLFGRIIARDNFNDLTDLIARYRRDPALTIRLSGSFIDAFRPFQTDLHDLIDTFVDEPAERAEMMQALGTLLFHGSPKEETMVAGKAPEAESSHLSPVKATAQPKITAKSKYRPRSKPRASADFKAKSTAGTAKVIVVKSGDSLYGLSKSHLGSGERFIEIAFANDLQKPFLILPGQRILIPPVAATPMARAKTPVIANTMVIEKIKAVRSTRLAEAKKKVREDLAEIRDAESRNDVSLTVDTEINASPGEVSGVEAPLETDTNSGVVVTTLIQSGITGFDAATEPNTTNKSNITNGIPSVNKSPEPTKGNDDSEITGAIDEATPSEPPTRGDGDTAPLSGRNQSVPAIGSSVSETNKKTTRLMSDLAWYYNFFNHLLILTLFSLIILGSVYYSNYVKQKNAIKFANLYAADPLAKL